MINIITVTVFGVEHRFDDGFTYGEAFWMTICSTICSCITTGTLIWDLYRTPDFNKSGEQSSVPTAYVFLSLNNRKRFNAKAAIAGHHNNGFILLHRIWSTSQFVFAAPLLHQWPILHCSIHRNYRIRRHRPTHYWRESFQSVIYCCRYLESWYHYYDV